jgi:uncharacterized protein YegL
MPAATKSLKAILDDIEYASISNKIIPLVFVADKSSSMANEAIDGEGVRTAKIEGVRQCIDKAIAYFQREPDLRNAVSVAVLSFGDGVDFTGFDSVDNFVRPALDPDANTPFCEAMNRVAAECLRYATELNSQGITPAMTSIIVITDGEPNDGPGHQEVARLMDLQRRRLAVVWAVGIDSSDRQRLEDLGFPPEQVFTVQETSWEKIAMLGSVSVTAIAQGQQPFSAGMGGARP